MTTILVVDDDPTVREIVVSYLGGANMDTVEAADGPTAVQHAVDHKPDLVVLDLMLPGFDGLEVFRRLRSHLPAVPVIMLTAKSDPDDRILGLTTGADDYVTKPFSARELVLRVQSVLRRTESAHPAQPADGVAVEQYLDDDLVVDCTSRRVTRAGSEVDLTTREFDLLAELIAHPGQVYSREKLMNTVWGWEFGDQSTVTVHIRRLRGKIENDPSAPTRIATVWGVGYRWDRTT